MAWKWGRRKQAQEPAPVSEELERAVLAELSVQQEAMNSLTILDFLNGVARYWQTALEPPSESRARRTEAVRRHRTERLVQSGLAEADAAALLVDEELAKGEALVPEGDACGRWPQQSPIMQVFVQTRQTAQELPEEALSAVRINVGIVPEEGQR